MRDMAEQVADVVREFDRPGLEKIAYFDPPDRGDEIREWLGEGFHLVAQPDGDLGRRLVEPGEERQQPHDLVEVAQRIRSAVRDQDTVARLGGDEFGVLLESCSLDEAMRSAETLAAAIDEFKFSWEDRQFSLGVSIGVVPITAENQDVAALLSAADSAAQAAKEAGAVTMNWGIFINSLISFTIVALALFFVVKGFNKMKAEEEAAPEAPPEPSAEEKILAEIRDLMKAQA